MVTDQHHQSQGSRVAVQLQNFPRWPNRIRPKPRNGHPLHSYTVLYAGLALGLVLAGFVSDTTCNRAAPVYPMAVLALGLFRACRPAASQQRCSRIPHDLTLSPDA